MDGRGVGGWLLYDYRGMNPIFWETVGEIPNVTRPCWLWVPAQGEVRLLVSYVDQGRFERLGAPTELFVSRADMVRRLEAMIRGAGPIAMEYSPEGALPRVSKVDAGTVEMVRGLGAEVVSSADLLQFATQRWGETQLASHRQAAAKLCAIVRDAFEYVGASIESGVTEYDAAEYIRGRFVRDGLESPDGPIVAVNAHASDPHFDPTEESSWRIGVGDWVLIDLWARLPGESTMFADITWTAYVGSEVPPAHQEVFDVVTGARDAAVSEMADAFAAGRSLQGWQVDRVAREYVAKAGYGDYFSHRLGHSLGREVHGNAVNLDGWETHDTRPVIPGLAVTVEPGIYLPEFGVRSEIDVYVGQDGPEVTTDVQRSVVLIRP